MGDPYPTEEELQARLPAGLTYKQGYPHTLSCPCGATLDWAGSPYFPDGIWIARHSKHSNDARKLAEEREIAEPYVQRERARILASLRNWMDAVGVG